MFYKRIAFGACRSSRVLLRRIGTAALILSAAPAFAGDRLTVMLDWFANPDHAPFILAQELSYFDAARADVGQVDGVIGAFRNFELHQMRIEGQEGRCFYPEAEGVPPYDELIHIADARP